MVTGPFINGAAVLIGGLLGALLGMRLPERLRVTMPSIFGLASLGIGILLIVKCANLPVMVLSTLLGTIIGELCFMERGINAAAGKARALLDKGKSGKSGAHEAFIQNFVAIVILFCASGTGIFGAMQEGMTGDPTILITKSFLDFFTAMIFATTLGIAVAFIAFPLVAIQLTLAWCAAADHPFDDGRFHRRRRPAAAGDRPAYLRHKDVPGREYAACAGDQYAGFRPVDALLWRVNWLDCRQPGGLMRI